MGFQRTETPGRLWRVLCAPEGTGVTLFTSGDYFQPSAVKPVPP